MNANDILDMIGDAKDIYVWDAQQIRQGSRVHGKRKLAVILLTAVMAVLLISCGVAAAVYGENIQAWFGYYWEEITGQDMEEGQTAVISRLSQEIGVSATDGDLTVTVDSATGSENIFYILLRVEGYRFAQRYRYGFETRNLEVDPEALPDTVSVSSYGVQYLGVDETGAGLFLIDFDYGTTDGEPGELGDLPMTLTLRNLTRRKEHEDLRKRKIAAEGEWRLSFTLDRSRLPEKVLLPDTEVGGMDPETGERTTVKLTDIVVSNTGIRFTYDSKNGTAEPFGGITVSLKNGSRIENGQGTGTVEADLTTRNYVWHWSIPLNIADISSVTIGGTEIKMDMQ